MTADEGVATLNPEAPDGSEAQDPPKGKRSANGKPATATYEYGVSLDGAGIIAVGEWEAEHASTSWFCVDGTDGDGQPTRYPLQGDPADQMSLGTIEASTNDKAVGLILRTEEEGGLPDVDLTERARVVRAAWQAHTSLWPIAIPVSRVETGRVPCPWRIEHTGLIGGTR